MQLNKVSCNTKIRHKTAINKTLSAMPLGARRVLYLCLAQLDSKRIIPQDQTFRISALEFSRICDIEPSTAYSQLKDAAVQLQQQTIGIAKDQLLPPIPRVGDRPWKQPAGKGVRMLNVTEFCDYEPGDGCIDVSFSRQMEPYICFLQNSYTTQVLLSATRIREANTNNLYQLIRKNISKGKESFFEVGVNELKSELELFTIIDGKTTYLYQEFRDFNKRVIKKGIKTIGEVTELKDLRVDIVERKQRCATILRFTYRIDNDATFNGFT
jgi:plasmid replication initiation protein